MAGGFFVWTASASLALILPLAAAIITAQIAGQMLPRYAVMYESIRSGVHRLYLYDLTRSLEQPLDFVQARGAAIAPDGHALAFMTVDDRTLQIGLFIGDLYAGEARQVHAGSDFLTQLTWSPDGTAVAYLSALNLYRDLAIYDMTAGQVIPFTRSDRCDSLAWSPDGAQIAVICLSAAGFPPEMQIRIYDRAAPEGYTVIPALDIYATASLAWSPDGEHLMIVAEARGFSPHLTLISLADHSVRHVAPTGMGISPAFDHRGSAIAHHAPQTGSSLYALYVADASASGDPDSLTSGRSLGVDAVNIPTFTPAWSPDDAYIAFSGYEDGARFTVTTLIADARSGGVRWRLPDPFPFNVSWLP
ncbi:hypothetical protein QM565_27710 [Geitlerinema splendidum]|nr:hypothetical protein [Geitlerinema splendidum]